MSKNTKHTSKMKKHYRKFIEKCDGEFKIIKGRGGTKDQYTVGSYKCSHKWHSSPSSSNVVKFKISDLNRLSRELGVEKQWQDYKDENTIYMCSTQIADAF
jgi:hypothetical protein